MVPRRFTHPVLLGLLTLAPLVSVSCDKVPLLAPAGTVITLVSTSNTLPINGSTDVVAVLIENGSTGTGANATAASGTPVHNGTLVSFTTTLGKVEPAEARTNNGRVTVKLTADGRSGKATLTAFSGGASKTLEVTIGAAAAERVLVSAAPTSVPASGGTVTVSARVEEASGNPIAGVPVAFTTTAGTLAATSAVTNSLGVATTTLSTTLAATITATAGGKTGTAAITARSAATVTLSVPTGAQTVGAPVAFTVTPSAGAILSNVVVNFGNGRTQSLGTITGASTAAQFYESDGIFVVRVTGTDADGAAVSASGSVALVGFTITGTATPATQTITPPGTGDGVVAFSVTGVPANVPIDRIAWDFKDTLLPGVRDTNSTTTSWRYTVAGTYNVNVAVHPVYGPVRTTQIQVVIR